MALLVSIFWPRHRKHGCSKKVGGGGVERREFQGEGKGASSRQLKKRRRKVIFFKRKKILNRIKVLD